MNNFFPMFKQGKAVNNPSEAAYAASIIMLTEIVNAQEQVYNVQDMQIAHRLKRVGMTNAFVTREQKRHSENAARLAFMLDMWRDLGRQAILVSYNDFCDILCHHDLMCGSLDRYIGDVPTENVADIERSQWQSEDPRFDRYFNLPFYPERSYYSNYDEFVEIQRAPFLFLGGQRDTSRYHITLHINEEMKLFVAAPKGFIHQSTVEIDATAPEGLDKSATKIVAAATQEVRDIIHKAERNGYVGRVTEIVPRQLPLNYDPFICSLCIYGVIIHSMWGAEAQDSTIRRYQELRDTIIGKAAPMMLNGNTSLLPK